ncbi:DUF4249 domain-containing protein [uncultured Kordia sp.]|uniref:DUF4249 domain-containing protein n=1 Tax=uncultured Kordia sp. TaxID=507699 RepID=UPI00261886CB|nr:DUF4249 domain-containing protein [uncultured Kordia sp.]
MKKLIFSLVILFIVSCETEVTNDITLNGSAPRLIINGGIERNTTTPLAEQRIELTSTIGFLDTGDPTPITDAQVSVNDGTTNFDFAHVGNGVYTNSDIVATLDTEYTVTIIWQNEMYVGSDTLTEVPNFDNVYAEFEAETLFTDEGYFVKFDATDPAGIENYYYYRVYKNGEFFIVADPGNSFTLVESDEFFDGQQRVGVKPNEEVIFQIGDTAKVEQLSITEAYHDFLVELFTQTGNQGLSFVGNPPPASIRSNVLNTDTPSNRALGYFYTVDVAEETIEIVE